MSYPTSHYRRSYAPQQQQAGPQPMMNLGFFIQQLNAAAALEKDPNASPAQRQAAQQIREQAMQSLSGPAQAPTPFGRNFETGGINSGPYSRGNNYNDLMNSGKMNPEYWGAIQQMASPKTAQIYENYDRTRNAAQNYLSSFDTQYPTTTFADGRKLQPNVGASAAGWAQKQNYIDSLPPWAKADMDLAISPPRSLNR